MNLKNVGSAKKALVTAAKVFGFWLNLQSWMNFQVDCVFLSVDEKITFEELLQEEGDGAVPTASMTFIIHP